MQVAYKLESLEDIERAVVEAENIFQDYYTQVWTRYQRNIEDWVNNKVSRDWFKRPYEYWRKKLELSDMDYYFERLRLKPNDMEWVEDKIEKCNTLKQKLSISPSPEKIILSDAEIALLTISAKSAKEAMQTND